MLLILPGEITPLFLFLGVHLHGQATYVFCSYLLHGYDANSHYSPLHVRGNIIHLRAKNNTWCDETVLIIGGVFTNYLALFKSAPPFTFTDVMHTLTLHLIKSNTSFAGSPQSADLLLLHFVCLRVLSLLFSLNGLATSWFCILTAVQIYSAIYFWFIAQPFMTLKCQKIEKVVRIK